jgi:subtilisin-like proprotein convertase family protein
MAHMKRIVLLYIITIFCQTVFAQTYTGSIGPISDDGVTNIFTSTVVGLSPSIIDTNHGLINICLNISHTYDSDLDVQLEAPDGTVVLLFSGVGGGDDNFTGTCLSDDAILPITQGSAPFSGSYQPMDNMGNVNNGQNGNGLWKLKITDTYAQDAGTLNSWSITFGNSASGPLTVDSSNLPLVLIDTYGQTIVDDPKIQAGMKIIYHGGNLYNNPTDIPNVYNGDVGIEIRGSYSASLPQKPYGFETRDSIGNNLDVSLLGMPAENDWILLALYNDKVFMRNTLAFKLFELLGHYAPRTKLCEVLIDGSYKGIYVFTEKIKRDNHRVDIAKLDLDDNAGDSVTGGYILKLDYHDGSNSWLSNFHPLDHSGFDVYYVYDYPDPAVITTQQKTYIQAYMNSLETAMYGTNFTDPILGYRAWLDVPSFVDYLIVNEVARNNDGFKKSYLMFKDKDSDNRLLKSGPVWDFDWAWKNVNECSIFSATDGSGWAYKVNDCSPDVNSNGWAVRLMQDTSFTHQLNCRYFNMRQTILDTTYLFHYIDSVHILVEEAQQRHYKKWPILGINVGTPEVDYQPNSYDGEIIKFKNWIKTRLAWLDANMPGNCPDVGITSYAQPSTVRIFPNPASDMVFIESDKAISNLELFSATGQLVYSSQSEIPPSIDLKNYLGGLYFVKVDFTDGSATVRKLIIEK